MPNAPRSLVHQKLVDAALSRNADLAVKILCDHIDEATKLIAQGLASSEDRKTPRRTAKQTARV